MTRLLIAAYLIEAGVLLVLAPWTSFWERNHFADAMPLIASWMSNAYVRGAVSGVGAVTALVGVRDLLGLLFARRSRVAPQAPEPPAA